MFQLSGANLDDSRRFDAGDMPQSFDEFVGEDILADGDEERAAELLHEHDEGDTRGSVPAGEDGLRGEGGLLHAEAEAEAEEDLVADPFGVHGVRPESGDEAGADGHDGAAGEHEGDIVADTLDEEAGGDAGTDEAKYHGELVDAGFFGADVFDGLEPDGEVVD